MINIDVINHVAADNEDGGGGGGNSISTLQADLILRDINFRGGHKRGTMGRHGLLAWPSVAETINFSSKRGKLGEEEEEFAEACRKPVLALKTRAIGGCV